MMPHTLMQQMVEIKSLQPGWALSRPNLVFVRILSVIYDIIGWCQEMYVRGIPVAFIVILLTARMATRTALVGKILQQEINL